MGESGKLRGHVAVLVAFAVMAVVVLFMLFRLSGSLSLDGSYEIKAIVPQAGTLTQGTSVTMAGARVGTVKAVHRRGVGALVDIRIDEDAVTPLAADTTAQLAVRTPLGENYIELIPGNSTKNLPSGDLVSPAQGSEYVDVDEIISVLQGRTRDRARLMLQGLGKGVGKRGDELGQTLDGAAGVLEGGSGVTQRIKDEREQIAQLVDQLGDVGAAVGERGASVRQLARQGLVTFRALADRDDSVRDLIATLPTTLRQVRQTTGTLRRTADTASPVVATLSNALREVRPAVRRLRPAAAVGREAVVELDRAAPRLEKTLGALRTASPQLVSTFPQLEKVFCQANPALRYIRPYIGDIISFATGLGAAANSYDAIGHTIRLMPVLGENAVLGLPTGVREAAFSLVRKGLMQGSDLGTGFEPFPDPGKAETGFQAGEQSRIGPKDVPSTGFKYPRIMRDC